jgi:alkylation response protein AidB-like acyl-CoA dehydrogenase
MTLARRVPRLRTPEQILQVAAALAEDVRAAASTRDADRVLPHDQVAALKSSGLLALSVPTAHGGIDAPAAVLAEVFRLLADADPSVAQIPQSHFTFLEVIALQGSAAQQDFFYPLVLDGALLANTQVERGPQPVNVDNTTLVAVGGDFVLTGRKFYCTGALFADWLAVRASVNPAGAPNSLTPKAVAFVPADAAGVRILDDWDGLGQRTTASGTVVLDASSVLFELGGTRSATASANLSRYWRDARTHTLHDATRWKLQHIGRYTLSGTKPPRHGQL